MNRKAIEAVLSQLPFNADGYIPDDKREAADRGDHVIVETDRYGDVILFCRVEDIGADANPPDTVCMAIGYQLTLTLPSDVSFETWSVFPIDDDTLSIMHHPGRIASKRPTMRSPGPILTRALFYRGIPGHRLSLDSNALPDGFNPPTDLDEVG